MEKKSTDSQYWEKMKKAGAQFLKETSAGRPKSFASPEELWGYACDYFKLCDETPWERKDFKGKDVMEVEIPTSAPYLWSGFEAYLFKNYGITTLKDYRTASRNEEHRDGAYKEFAEVIRAIDSIMTNQKLSGALVGAYSPNLVARLEGLAEKTENEVVIKETRVGFE